MVAYRDTNDLIKCVFVGLGNWRGVLYKAIVGSLFAVEEGTIGGVLVGLVLSANRH